MNIKDFTVGQPVWIFAVHQKTEKEQTGVVNKIGRKYLFVKPDDNTPGEIRFKNSSPEIPFLISDDGVFEGNHYLFSSEEDMDKYLNMRSCKH